MNQARTSLVSQLSKSLLLWVCGLWAVGVIGVAWYMHVEITEGFDSALYQSAMRLRELASFEVREIGRHASDDELRDHQHGSASGTQEKDRHPHESDQSPGKIGHRKLDGESLVYQVFDASGKLIIRSSEAPVEALSKRLDDGFSESGKWRVYTTRHPTMGFLVHLADSTGHRLEAQRETMMWLLYPVLALMPLLAFIIRRITSRELRGVGILARDIGLRNGRNLSAIDGSSLPSELAAVAQSTNQLLNRLQASLDVERALAANAAHELRTPIAAFRLRLSNALSQQMPDTLRSELQSANQSLEQLSRRIDKLLQLSRAESSAALNREAVDLGTLASLVAQEFWRQPEAFRRLKLVLPEDSSPQAMGDVDTLALALRNLVENALKYSGDATVSLEVTGPASLLVRDEGPGVSAEALKTFGERHVRQSRDKAGYGLGLSIVQTIVEKHDGKLRLSSPLNGLSHGFEARIDLPPLI